MLITALAVSITACQKAANGEVGPQGTTGPAGPAGPKGDPGSANVIYSPWNTVTLTGSGTSYAVFMNAPQITQTVLDQAAVFVYINFTTGEYYALPYMDGTRLFRSRLYVGRVELTANYATQANQRIRYVIIPGGVSTGRRAAVDMTNYAAVKAFYNLPN